MLHPDFYKVVEKVVELGFPWGMTTNGTLLEKKDAKRLKRLKLYSVTISLDGLEGTHEWLRNVPGCSQKTLDAVRDMQSAGILVQITSVIHKRNFHELEALYQLMCDMHVFSWRVINLEPIGRVREGGEELLLAPEEFKRLLEFIRSKRYSRDTPLDVRFGCSHYLSFKYEREVRDNYFICGAGIYEGSILCNGDIYACLDIERRKELVQGNVMSD
jgi:MoaA/NifB/PqqE/SkfB family radical SAM enzyme